MEIEPIPNTREALARAREVRVQRIVKRAERLGLETVQEGRVIQFIHRPSGLRSVRYRHLEIVETWLDTMERLK